MKNLKTSPILLFLAVALQGAPNSVTIKELDLHIDAHTAGNTLYHGYTAHRFTVQNSGQQVRKLEFRIPARATNEEFRVNTITQTFSIGPGTHPVTIYQPPLPLSSWNNNVRILCEGKVNIIESGWDNRLDTANNAGYQRNLVVLLARSQNQTALEGITAQGTTTETRFVEYSTAPEEVEKWPAHWLAYSGYDAIVLTKEEWERAMQNIKTALRRWSLAGGKLVVLGTTGPGAGETLQGLKQHGGFGNYHELGATGEPETTQRHLVALLNSDSMPIKNVPSIPLVEGLGEGVREFHNEDDHHHHHYYNRGNEDGGGFNRFFQVVEGARAPVGLVILVLTAFVILAGPVNLAILSKKGKRAWFLWTLPAISFATSGLVFIVAFFGEGVRPKIRIDSVTVLDQGAQEAVSIGGVAIYAPVAPSKLEFSGNTEATPLVDRNSSDSGSARRVEWQDGGSQWFTGKWVASRIPAHFALRRVEHREERIQVDWSGDKPVIVNGLGVELDEFALASPDGQIFKGKNIPAGAKSTLTGSPEGTVGGPYQIQSIIRKAMDGSAGSPGGMVTQNTYFAKFSSPSPFVENPLGKKSAKQTHTGVLIGLLGEEAAQ